MNFNSLCEGQKGHNTRQKGHNTGQKGLLRVKRDKTRPFRTKGQEGHLFSTLFFPWARVESRVEHAHRFRFLWIMNLSRYEWLICFRFMSFIYISRRLARFVTLLKTLCWFSSWPSLSKLSVTSFLGVSCILWSLSTSRRSSMDY